MCKIEGMQVVEPCGIHAGYISPAAEWRIKEMKDKYCEGRGEIIMDEPKVLLDVPHVCQVNEYSCGPAAVQMVLAYMGMWAPQGCIAEELGTTEEEGTGPGEMYRYLSSLGIKSLLQSDSHIEELIFHVDAGNLSIINYQAWREPKGIDYKYSWIHGHYGVVVGYNENQIFIQDPSIRAGAVGYMDKEELLERWHDLDESGEKLNRLSIVVMTDGPKRVKYIHIP